MITLNLSNGIKITKVKAASAAGTSTVEGDVIDMSGFEGVLFFTTIAVANSGNIFKAQIGAASDGADAADLEGTAVVATNNNQVVWLDVYRADPSQQYIRPVVVRGASSAVGDIYALQYESRKEAIDNNVATEIIGKLVVNPFEGTA